MKKTLFVLIVLFHYSCSDRNSNNTNSSDPVPAIDSTTVSKIWDKGEYNSFPDLIRFNNEFYCALREGSDHVSNANNGTVRIIKSKDGQNWESVALLESDSMDIREARLSTTPDGKIMAILAAGVFTDGKFEYLFPMVSFSNVAGEEFSTLAKATVDPEVKSIRDWIWRVTWHDGVGYGVLYQVKDEGWEAYLMKTNDGKSYQNVSNIDVGGNPSEATIRFDKNDQMYVLIRRDAGDHMGMLVKSKPPYNQWRYDTLNYRLGGPNFLFLNDTSLVVGTRFYSSETYTAIFNTDLDGKISNSVTLPSGGDTSYPGMVLFENKLWVAYYSSHEEKPSIYLAKIPLGNLD